MPHADQAAGNNNVGQPLDITNTDLTDEELGPEEEQLIGNGAEGQMGIVSKSGDIKAGDTEKSGAKGPDAMGAGA